jgi:tetratricopeptide (TPR) repeat protein
MILGGDLTPVGELSGAFLAPRSAAHLQFAYYQCSLVVEYINERVGFDKLTEILRDLSDGTTINQAIARHTVPLPEIEKQFEAYAHQHAEQWAPALRWGKPLGEKLLAQGGDAAWAAWAKANPDNFYVLTRQAGTLIEEERWADAKPVLQKLVGAFPQVDGLSDAYQLLAKVHRELGETAEEQRVLARLAERDDKAVGAYQRLMELASASGDWAAAIENANRYLAVNPLVPLPYRFLAQAGEKTGQAHSAIRAYRALLELDPPNPAEVHFQLACQLRAVGDPAARRHVLRALEEAPRYRAALRLLLELSEASNVHDDGRSPM